MTAGGRDSWPQKLGHKDGRSGSLLELFWWVIVLSPLVLGRTLSDNEYKKKTLR